MARQLTFIARSAPRLVLEPALSLRRIQPGDIVHVVSGEVAGIDTADAIYRLAPRWGGTAEEALTVCEREGWDYTALSAAGAYIRANPHSLRDPDIVARMLPPRRAANAGLVGARPGVYPQTWYYDRVSAYPALALHGVPDPLRWRVERSVPSADSACGYVVGRWRITDRSALADSAEQSVDWLTIDEYRCLCETESIRDVEMDYVLVTDRREWDWFVDAQRELYAKRLMHPEGNVYKIALNGIIGRLASSGGYERWLIGAGGDDAIPVGRGRYLSYRVVARSRAAARAASVTHDIIARQRLDMARMARAKDVVWWYVDAVLVTSPLPPQTVGTSPGLWRLQHSGESRVIDWRGGIVAGRPKLATIPRVAWGSALAAG